MDNKRTNLEEVKQTMLEYGSLRPKVYVALALGPTAEFEGLVRDLQRWRDRLRNTFAEHFPAFDLCAIAATKTLRTKDVEMLRECLANCRRHLLSSPQLKSFGQDVRFLHHIARVPECLGVLEEFLSDLHRDWEHGARFLARWRRGLNTLDVQMLDNQIWTRLDWQGLTK